MNSRLRTRNNVGLNANKVNRMRRLTSESAEKFAAAPKGVTIRECVRFGKEFGTGWNGPVMLLQDLFVEPHWRQHGIASALIARVAAQACAIGSPIIELTVRADNPAQDFYLRNGFQPVPQCLTYVIAGPALGALAARDTEERERLVLAG